MFYSSYPCQQPSFSISNTIKSTNDNLKILLTFCHPTSFSFEALISSYGHMALTKMINKRTKKTNHLHLVIISPILFSQYVLHPVFISIKIITNKRTDKGDCLHFATISPSFVFKTLLPVFISINIITNKKDQTKMPCLHFAIVSPSFFFKVLHPVFIPTYQNNY